MTETVMVISSVKKFTKHNSAYLKAEIAFPAHPAHAPEFASPSLAIAVWWDYPHEKPISAGKIVDITYTIDEYKGSQQVCITSVVLSSNLNQTDFIPQAPESLGLTTEKLQERLDKLINTAAVKCNGNTDLCNFHQACKNILSAVMPQFMVAPGAGKIHHAYQGGLMLHSIEVAEIASAIFTRAVSYHKLPTQESYSLTLLIWGALLHDIGKIWCYSTDCAGIGYSSCNTLLGHALQGLIFVSGAFACNGCAWTAQTACKDGDVAIYYNTCMDSPLFCQLLDCLRHMIASHGGPDDINIKPATLEAAIIHAADEASANTAIIIAATANGAGTRGDSAGGSLFEKHCNAVNMGITLPMQFDSLNRTIFAPTIPSKLLHQNV